MKYTIIVRYMFDKKWLNLTRKERNEIEANKIMPIFDKYKKLLRQDFLILKLFMQVILTL